MPPSSTGTTGKPKIDQDLIKDYQHLIDKVAEWGEHATHELRIRMGRNHIGHSILQVKLLYEFEAKIVTNEDHLLVKGGFKRTQEGALKALEKSIKKRKKVEKRKREADKKKKDDEGEKETEKEWGMKGLEEALEKSRKISEEIEDDIKHEEAEKKWMEEMKEREEEIRQCRMREESGGLNKAGGC